MAHLTKLSSKQCAEQLWLPAATLRCPVLASFGYVTLSNEYATIYKDLQYKGSKGIPRLPMRIEFVQVALLLISPRIFNSPCARKLTDNTPA